VNFLPILELAIVDVTDFGVPGRERIVIRPTQPVDLGQFFLVLGFQNTPNAATPFRNAALWLGNFHIDPPAWIIVFTGLPPAPDVAQPVDVIDPTFQQRVLYYYLGFQTTVFDKPGTLPMMFRVTGVLIGKAPVTPPHLALPPAAQRRP
jgi:hypothetical protein